jgi:hypothetical protein
VQRERYASTMRRPKAHGVMKPVEMVVMMPGTRDQSADDVGQPSRGLGHSPPIYRWLARSYNGDLCTY